MEDDTDKPVGGCCGDPDAGRSGSFSSLLGSVGGEFTAVTGDAGPVKSGPPPGQHIACRYLKVYSDPPEAHIFWAKDGSYWGLTGLDKPVDRHVWMPVEWDAQKKQWIWPKNVPFVNGSYEMTVIAKRSGLGEARATLWIPGRDFNCEGGTPEELAKRGKLGVCPQQTAENTSTMMVVLQPGDSSFTG